MRIPILVSCWDHFVYAPCQWEMTSQCNALSHWLGTYTKWSLRRNYLIAVAISTWAVESSVLYIDNPSRCCFTSSKLRRNCVRLRLFFASRSESEPSYPPTTCLSSYIGVSLAISLLSMVVWCDNVQPRWFNTSGPRQMAFILKKIFSFIFWCGKCFISIQISLN